MTRRLFGSLGAIPLLACLTMALSSEASAQTNRVRVHVPFDFQVSGEAMSAGQYIFESPINGGIIYLTANSTGARHAVLGMPIGNPSNPRKPQVVFERLGDRYRLAEVWLNGAGAGSGLKQTKAEKEYAKQNGSGSLVALSFKQQ
jgi:hypothetical protein